MKNKNYKVLDKNRRLIETVIMGIAFYDYSGIFEVRFILNSDDLCSWDCFTLELDGYEMHKYGNVLQVGNSVDVIIGRGHREWTVMDFKLKEDQRRWIRSSKEIEEENELQQYSEMTYEEEMKLEKQLIEAEKQLPLGFLGKTVDEDWNSL